jgi:hypothetical protein
MMDQTQSILHQRKMSEEAREPLQTDNHKISARSGREEVVWGKTPSGECKPH